MLAEGVDSLRRLAAEDRSGAMPGGETRPGPDVDAMAHIRGAVRGFFHPVGTCAIGRVVDGNGAIHGVDALFVADASIMPTIPRANTNLSVLAVAERLAPGIGDL